MSSPSSADGARQSPAPAHAHAPAPASASAKQEETTSADFQEYGMARQRNPTLGDRNFATASLAKEAPLPYDDEDPPLPEEALPEDDGWTYLWDYGKQDYIFYNNITGQYQWENPRQPNAAATNNGPYARSANDSAAPAPSSGIPGISSPPKRKYGGYNPAIHGNYDPNADYAREAEREEEEAEAAAAAAAAAAALPNANPGDYTTTAQFNRYTGRYQQAGMNPEHHNDENKSRRQMNAYFDVDAAANSHDGRSLKAERRGKTLSKKQVQNYQHKRREKKEEKRRAWLRD